MILIAFPPVCFHIVAPEVALGLPYNAKCDVYSFALLLWEIMNLTKPFGYNLTLEKLQLSVWDEKHASRPPIRVVSDGLEIKERSSLFLTSPKASWTESLKTLVESAWAHSISARPSMAQIEVELKRQLTHGIEHMESFHGGLCDTLLDSKRLSHNRRRSTFVYQPPGIAEDELAANTTSQDAKILMWSLFSPRSVLNLRSKRNVTNLPSSRSALNLRSKRNVTNLPSFPHSSRGGSTPVEEEIANLSE